ncbi:protein kinase [Streptomyces sp. NPDC057702]|uniref:protein kinase domain-containing protein n=1 Tax=unclassified Streptomyces TaxID=2593676 RepID=UPI0036C38169
MRPLEAGDPPSIGAYALRGRLGSGGMGEVFLGRTATGRDAAVKVARAEWADDAEFRRRFAREVDAARRVDARFTAAVLDADPHAPRPWLATEYIAGVSITTAVADRGPLPEDALRALLAGIARALEAIHAVGLTHRDLKPSNVLLAGDGPRVIDFGIARSMEHTQITQTGQIAGSPGYMAPEQLRGETVGAHTDVYALGATLVYAATGRGPYGEGDLFALVYRTVEQDPDLTGVPAALRPTLARCLAKEPSQRPTVARLRAEFEIPDLVRERRWLPSGLATPPAPDPKPPPAPLAPSTAPPGSAPAPPPGPSPYRPPTAPAGGVPGFGPPPSLPAPAPPAPWLPPGPGSAPPATRPASRRAVLAAVVGGGAALVGGGGYALWQGFGDGRGGAARGGTATEGRDGGASGERVTKTPTPGEATGGDQASAGGASTAPSTEPGTRDPSVGGEGRLPAIVSGTGFGQAPTMADTSGAPPRGLVVEMLIEGEGRAADKGSRAAIHYVMQVWGGNTVVDSSHRRGQAYEFTLGVGAVIKGWDEALVGKRVGSRVEISVPPEKAYGDKGLPSTGIKGTDTLLFVCDVMSVPAPGSER